MAKYKCARLDTHMNLNRKDISCKDQPYLTSFNFPNFLGLREPIVYKSCAGNEEAAMRYRYMKDTPRMNLHQPTFQRALQEVIDKMSAFGNVCKMTPSEFLSTKKGALGKRYREAMESLFHDGLDLRKDSNIMPFIKNEKYFEQGKFPRLVYSRNPKFGSLWALFILPIEHILVKFEQVQKGKNFKERGNSFRDLIYGDGYWYAENDFSQFEASQRAQLFDQVQWRIFTSFMEPWLAEIWPLYEEKLTKHGWTLRGLLYYLFGLMASGDFETGCFNTIFNLVACRYFEISHGFGHFNFIVDGDDGVIRVPQASRCINTFSDFGFEAKLIIKYNYQDVDFCSSRFIQVSPNNFYQVQNLVKLLESLPHMINKNFDHSLADYYGSLGYMYRVLYSGIPVFEDLGEFLCTASCNRANLKMLETVHYGAFNSFQTHTSVPPVHYEMALNDISIAFNYTFTELEVLTDFLRTSALEFPPERSFPYKTRDRPKDFQVPVEFLDAIRVIGKPHRRPKKY
jgi:hypothetical protein